MTSPGGALDSSLPGAGAVSFEPESLPEAAGGEPPAEGDGAEPFGLPLDRPVV